MAPPTTGADLQQFVCALQWVETAVPNFSTLVGPLHTFMEKVYSKAGSRTKRAVAKFSLAALEWSEVERTAFEKCTSALKNQVTLAHRDDAKRLCIFTDASDSFWSGILT